MRPTDEVEVPLCSDPAFDAHDTRMWRQLCHEGWLTQKASRNKGMMGMQRRVLHCVLGPSDSVHIRVLTI